MNVIADPFSRGAEVLVNAKGLFVVVFKNGLHALNVGEGEKAFGGEDFISFHDAEEMVRVKSLEGLPPMVKVELTTPRRGVEAGKAAGTARPSAV